MIDPDSNKNFFLISADGIDDTQRKQFQTQISLNSLSWWHQQQNLWIVQGGTGVHYWQNLLSPFVRGIYGNYYVFGLPTDEPRVFASYSEQSGNTWLKEEPFNNAAIKYHIKDALEKPDNS